MLNKDTILVSLKLFVITAVTALCLSVVNKITYPIIKVNSAAAEVAAQQELLPEADSFMAGEIPKIESETVVIEKLNAGITKNGELAGYVITAVSNAGYGGNIKTMIGVDAGGKVTRIKITESAETAGLGANASKPQFAGQFEGASKILTVVKGEKSGQDEVSAISGATVTSKAVTSCVNAAIQAVEIKNNEEMVEKTAQALEQIKKETNKQISESESGDEKK